MKLDMNMEKAIFSMRFEIGFYRFNDGTEGYIYEKLNGEDERVDFEDGYFIATSKSVKRFMEEPQQNNGVNPIEMMKKAFEFNFWF